MSIATLISCPEIQAQLNEIWVNDANIKREDLPLTELLLSPFNVGGNQLQKVVSPGDGKSRLVDLIYTPRALESETSESTGNTECVSSNVPTELSTQYDVGSDYLQADRLIPMDQLRYKCEQDDAYIARMIMMMMDQIGRTLETHNFNQLALLKGKWASDIVGTVDGSDNYQVATKLSGGAFDFDAYQKITAATKYSGYSMSPIVIGGFNIENYFTAAKSGCCSTQGVNLEALYNQYGVAVLTSYRSDTAFGDANHFMAMEPGAVQLIYWNEYEGVRGVNTFESETLKMTVLVDPKNGMKYDFKAVLDCNGKWSFFLRSYSKLAGLPTDMFQGTDRLTGVTLVNGFKIVNP